MPNPQHPAINLAQQQQIEHLFKKAEEVKAGPIDAHFIREKELAFIREKPLATPKEIRDFVSMLMASGEIQITGK